MKKKLLDSFLLFFLCIAGVNAQEGFIGEIRMFAGDFPPRYWAFCEGQLLPINQNQALFSILGTQYGGNGTTNFALPDLRGRVAVHVGQGNGLTPIVAGQQVGTEVNILTSVQLPPHTHSFNAVSEDGTTASPQGAFMAGTKALDPEYASIGTIIPMNSALLGPNSSANVPVENREPSLVLNYIICLQGIFPSRN